ncbi:MAG TPA: hypothetical protein VET90_03600 [Candidatus Binatus sp.]|nr:hypothetical protein [Candidatus Binatus sp.]
MTFLVSAFGVAGRLAGDLLTSALGWASILLFGRVPASHRVLLVTMTALSFLWLLVLLALAVPSLASFMVATTPHPTGLDPWIGTALGISAILLPLAVGLAGYLVPAEGERESGLSILPELLRGYLLVPVIAGLLVFLSGVGLARKVRSRRRGWSDVHVAVVIETDDYDQVVDDLVDALDRVGLGVTVHDAPRLLTLPARVLTVVAGPNVRRLRPERLVELRARDLRVGVYPSDIAISGTGRRRTRARAAVLARLAASSAHLTTTAEAQSIEDRLAAIADGAAGSRIERRRRSSLREIDASLLDLEISSNEWDILLRERLQVERDLLLGRPRPTGAARRARGHEESRAGRERAPARGRARSASR